jgi:ABC-type glycerol-3-phosphate transport system substrate-binding protein
MPRRATATIRSIALIGGALAVAVTLGGCSSKPTGSGALSGPTGAPAASSTPSVSPSPVVTVTVTASAPAPYPSNYPAAILAAWKAKDTARLAQLTSASTANHLINDLGSVNQDWIHIRDDGAMGSSYASY